MDQTWADKAMTYVTLYGMNIVAALLIFLIGKWVAKLVSNLVGKALEKSKMEKTLAVFLTNITFYLLLLFVIIAALNKLGVETTSFVALIGAAGLAVGLALQGSLANFAAGVMIIMFHPFGVGDYVEAGGGVGTVQDIQIFSTVIITDDKKKVIVPNAKITGDKITVYPKK